MSTFEAFMEKAVQDGVVPGVVVAARGVGGRLNYTKAFPGPGGYKEDSLFELASLSKLVTSVAALQLVERGLVGLEEDVSRYIPSYASKPVLDGFAADGSPITHARKNLITLRGLLTHSAGGAYTFVDERLAKYVEVKGLDDDGTIDGKFGYPLSYEPGESWFYSDAADRVGQIVERISGVTLEEYFKKHIFEPLGITSGTFWPASGRQIAFGLRPDPNGPVVINSEIGTFTTGLKECFGGQGLFMNTQDYCKILYSLLVDDGLLLKPETSAKIFTPCLDETPKKILLDKIQNPDWALGDIPPTGEYDWSLAGLLIDGDSHRFRNRNAVTWSGAPSLFWFIDRTADICGVFSTQILPPSDPACRPVLTAFEEEIYNQAKKLRS